MLLYFESLSSLQGGPRSELVRVQSELGLNCLHEIKMNLLFKQMIEVDAGIKF